MKILVNGREAVLKANASFEYVSENPLFTEAEDYTMEIPFPMNDCPQNISIFGPLHVKGVDISKVSFPCEIQTDAFVKSGILTITSVSDTEVKGQFLEGMSQQNFASSLPDVYLTDLDFSQWDGQNGGWENFPDFSKVYDSQGYVIGWKANKSGPEWGWDEMDVLDRSSGEVVLPLEEMYGEEDLYKSRRIYLSHLIDLVGLAIGYSIDFSILKAIPMFKYILVVNARHHIITDVGYGKRVRPLNLSLPYWTIKEFLDQLALFFGCIYVVNGKNITFKACSQTLSLKSEHSLAVLDNFAIELTDEKSKYRGSQTLKLPDSCNPNSVNSCQGFIDDKRIPHVDITLKEFLANIDYAANYFWYDNMPTDATSFGNDERQIYYITDLQRWAIITKISNEGGSEEQPDGRFQLAEILNQFDLFADGVELKIAPCPLEEVTYYGFQSLGSPFNYAGALNKINMIASLPAIDFPIDPDDIPYDGNTSNLPPAYEVISSGVPKKEDYYYDKLWVVLAEHRNAYSDTPYPNTREYEPILDYTVLGSYDENGNYVPVTDEKGETKLFAFCGGFHKFNFTLTPQDKYIKENISLPKVDETKLYRYKFLAKTLPSPTSVFLIKGKRYACLKLTAQITVKGMSELVEGEFYEIID